MIVSTHPLADGELVDGAVNYTKLVSAQLARDFISEFERSIDLLRSNPMLGAKWAGRYRRLPLPRFPYSLVYILTADRIRLIALAHQRRRPGYWRGRY